MRVLAYSLVIVLSLVSIPTQAQFELGKHYVQLPSGSVVETDDKIEVREFFWYGCPHCYSLEPYLERWLKTKPDEVAYVRTPGVARKWIPHARAYYTFEALGITEKVHRPFFDAIHKGGQKLSDEASMAAFVAAYGVDQETFRKAFNSFGVKTQVQKAKQLNFRYGVDSVPTITVDGRYKANVRGAGGPDQLMRLINYLVEQSKLERKSAKN
ncbi:MAG: thiol:disulfide interchange protein DsbA/DsbL [Nitrospira sp.]|jgi:thiol:disulfide interchange protein DsbA|nr:thiol:disulfide interchange protein DsbA/DsbL [Nitrospira sp.]